MEKKSTPAGVLLRFLLLEKLFLLLEDRKVQDDGDHDERGSQNLCNLHQVPFHGAGFILLPIAPGGTGQGTKSCILPFLPQHYDCQCNTNQNKNDSQYCSHVLSLLGQALLF